MDHGATVTPFCATDHSDFAKSCPDRYRHRQPPPSPLIGTPVSLPLSPSLPPHAFRSDEAKEQDIPMQIQCYSGTRRSLSLPFTATPVIVIPMPVLTDACTEDREIFADIPCASISYGMIWHGIAWHTVSILPCQCQIYLS